MHPATGLIAVLVCFLAGVDADAGADRVSFNNTPCEQQTAVDDYASAFYSSMVTTIGEKILKENEYITGAQVAVQEYRVATDVLSKLDTTNCNTANIIGSAARGLAVAKNKSLKKYIKETAFSIGYFLSHQGRLQCDNAVTLGLHLYQAVEAGLKGLDLNLYTSYQRAVNIGLYNYLTNLGFNYGKILQQVANIYVRGYSLENPEQGCKNNKSS